MKKYAELLYPFTQNIVVISGAGLSKASGLPTYRDGNGIWDKSSVEKYCTPQGFDADPLGVLKWHLDMREMYSAVQPNPAHYALAKLDKHFSVTHITQNVDGLLTGAGAKNVIEIHGSIHAYRCADCDTPFPELEVSLDDTCQCGGALRPGIVMFNENLDAHDAHDAQRALHAATRASLIFSVGTSLEVSTGINLLWAAAYRNAPAVTVNINPDTSALGFSFDHNIDMKAEDALPELVDALIELQVQS